MIFCHHHRSEGNEHLHIQKPWVDLTSICHNKASFQLSNQNRCYFFSSKNASRFERAFSQNIPCVDFFHGTILATFIFFSQQDPKQTMQTLDVELYPQAPYCSRLYFETEMFTDFSQADLELRVAQAVKMYYTPASATLTLEITGVCQQAWLPSCFPERFLLTILYCSTNHVCHLRHLWPH